MKINDFILKEKKFPISKNTVYKKVLVIFMCIMFLGISQVSAQLLPLTFTQGRIAMSHDGNSYDLDDVFAVAVQWGILTSYGVQNKVVHWDICNNMHLNNSTSYQEELESGRGWQHFPGFADPSTFMFDDQTQLSAAIANFKREAEASSANNRLFFICAGPMEVPWRMINAVNASARQYITCISHSTWNEEFDEAPNSTHTWADMKSSFSSNGVVFIDIRDQNNLLGTDDYDYSYLRNMPAGTCIDPAAWDWVATRDPKGDKGLGDWDCSDAGMLWYLLTGDDLGSGPKLRARFENPICNVGPQYTITASASSNGSISPSGSVLVNSGTNKTFTITANSGYEVDIVTVDGVSQGSITTYTFNNVTANHSISATFRFSGDPTDVALIGSWVQGTTHAKVAGSNRALVVMLYGEGAGNISASSVTYGGQIMTKVVEKAFLNSAYSYTGAFVLNEAGVAAASSGTIAITWSTAPSSGSDATSAFFSNVNQSLLTGATASNGLVGTTITTSALANGDGDMVLVAGTGGGNGTFTINNGFTRGIAETSASFGDITSAYKVATGANETPSLTISASMRQTIVGFVLKKSSGTFVTYSVTLLPSPNGTITISPTGGTYNEGSVVTLTAVPNSGYVFSGWTGDLAGTTNPAPITMNGNKSVGANFTAQATTYTLTTTATNGTITPNPVGPNYAAGTVVTLTPTPNSGYQFNSWSGDLTGSTNPGSITMNANKSVTANFTQITGCVLPWTDPGLTVNANVVNNSFGSINISCAANGATISVTLQGVGADASDYCRVYYKVDGGAQQTLVAKTGAFATQTFSVSGIVGTSVQIIVQAATSWADEFYYITNLSVAEASACIDNLPWAKADITVNNLTITNQSQGVVNTSCASTVTITADVEGLGGLDLADYCRMQYKVNGGTTLQPLFDINNLAGAFAKKLFSKTVTATSIELVLNAKNTFADEIYKITNIKITSNGLKSASIATNIEMANAVEDGISIYPNPASGILNIDFPNAEIRREIKVFNMVGQLIHSVQTKNASAHIDVQALKLKGIVMVQVIAGNKVSNHKILVK